MDNTSPRHEVLDVDVDQFELVEHDYAIPGVQSRSWFLTTDLPLQVVDTIAIYVFLEDKLLS